MQCNESKSQSEVEITNDKMKGFCGKKSDESSNDITFSLPCDYILTEKENKDGQRFFSIVQYLEEKEVIYSIIQIEESGMAAKEVLTQILEYQKNDMDKRVCRQRIEMYEENQYGILFQTVEDKASFQEQILVACYIAYENTGVLLISTAVGRPKDKCDTVKVFSRLLEVISYINIKGAPLHLGNSTAKELANELMPSVQDTAVLLEKALNGQPEKNNLEQYSFWQEEMVVAENSCESENFSGEDHLMEENKKLNMQEEYEEDVISTQKDQTPIESLAERKTPTIEPAKDLEATQQRVQSRRSEEIGRKKKEGCYIATAVYDSYDAPEVLKLRHFRDYTLKKTALGQAFIRFYYFVSPPVAKHLKNAKRANIVARKLLNYLIKHLS